MENRAKIIVIIGVLLCAGHWGITLGQPVNPPQSASSSLPPLVSDAPAVPLDHRADMVWVEGRDVTWNTPDARGQKSPTPGVKLRSSGFYMDRTEVTNRQFASFLSQADSNAVYYDPRMDIVATARDQFSPRAGRDDYPVAWVDWRGAYAFAAWAGKSLPTEDEWIIAALSGGDVGLNGMLSAVPDCALVTENPHTMGAQQRIPGPAATGALLQTTKPTGLSDLAGNLAEWTLTEILAPNPSGGATTWLVVKGGSYLDPPENFSPVSRTFRLPSERLSALGFRCVLRVRRS